MAHTVANTSFTLAVKARTAFLIFLIFSLTAEPLWAQKTRSAQRTGSTRTVRKKPPAPTATTRHHFKLGLALWGETIELLAADGRREDVDVKYSGASLGYELSRQWVSWGLWAELQAMILQGQAASAGNSITYNDSSKTNLPFIADAGFSYYPHKNVSLSLGAGVLFHSLSLEPPSSVLTTYEFKYSSPIKFLYALKLNWFMNNNWTFEQKIMAFANSQLDTGWNVSFNYAF